MRKILVLLLLFVFPLFASARGELRNYPLPQNPDTLRILAVGNSFSDDGTEYLPALLHAAGLDNVIVARLYIGGCTLERHCEEYESASRNYVYSKAKDGAWKVVSREASIVDGLRDEPWDIVTMQEASGVSGIYDNYEEWLPRLAGIIRKEVSNPRAALVWHQTWAYATNSDHPRFPDYGKDQERMQASIQSCVDKLCDEFGIETVIPSGVAVAMARRTRLNNSDSVPSTCKVYELTRDGYHLNRQHGRYLAACVWFETLVKPTLGVPVKGNDYRLLDTEYSIPKADAKLCQSIAAKAVKRATRK